jgi:hypothetical protein
MRATHGLRARSLALARALQPVERRWVPLCIGPTILDGSFHNRTGFDETPISTLPNEAIALFSRNVIEPLHLLPRHFRQPPAPPPVPFSSVRV